MDQVYVKTSNLNSWVSKYFRNQDIISIDDFISVIEDLGSRVEELEEELEDEKRDKKENYRPIPLSEYYGVSERD